MKEIERAIIISKEKIESAGCSDEELEYRKVCLQALREKLDRQENKALTESKLKEMVGEPVWDDFDDVWRILEDVDYIDELESEICFTDLFQVVYHDCRFYKHKPNEGAI